MALKKATMTLTEDGSGSAETTLKLSGVQPVGRTRPATLLRVTIDDTALTGSGGTACFILSEGLDAGDVNPGDSTDTAFVPGKELLYVPVLDSNSADAVGLDFYPLWNVSSGEDGNAGSGIGSGMFGAPQTGEGFNVGDALVYIDQPTVIGKLENMIAGSNDVCKVSIYYMTAGDFRF